MLLSGQWHNLLESLLGSTFCKKEAVVKKMWVPGNPLTVQPRYFSLMEGLKHCSEAMANRLFGE